MSKITVFVVILTLIIMGSIAFTVLAIVRLVTSHLLKKSGYHANKSQVVYQQLQTDLNQISTDLTDISMELDEVESHIKNMEFLKYAQQNAKLNK